MIPSIKIEAQRRGITRICHFTPSRNLAQILTGKVGILSTRKLQDDERSVFAPTDLLRLDGFRDHISCTIEFPNAWYFDKARSNEVPFKDWVVLFINPKYLWLDGTMFCPRNAAAARGSQIATGENAFNSLYAQSIQGAYGKTFSRTGKKLDSCPTDEQAEVLVPDVIALGDILGIAVQSSAQAQNELVRLKLLGVADNFLNSLRIVVAPDLFNKQKLSEALKNGNRPIEKQFNPEQI